MNKILFVIAFSSSLAFCKNEKPANDNNSSEIQVPVIEVKDISIAETKDLIKNTAGLVILDVRSPDETAYGKIENAIEIDYWADDFTEKVNQLDKSKTYLVYCQSSKRSSKAAAIMKDNGFTHLFNMKGGYNDWSEE